MKNMGAKKIFKWRILSNEEKAFIRGFHYKNIRQSLKTEDVKFKDLYWNDKFIWILMYVSSNKYRRPLYRNKYTSPTMLKKDFVDNELQVNLDDVSTDFLEEMKLKMKWFYWFISEHKNNTITFKYFSKSRQLDSSWEYL